jgi:hypothetical protein
MVLRLPRFNSEEGVEEELAEEERGSSKSGGKAYWML